MADNFVSSQGEQWSACLTIKPNETELIYPSMLVTQSSLLPGVLFSGSVVAVYSISEYQAHKLSPLASEGQLC